MTPQKPHGRTIWSFWWTRTGGITGCWGRSIGSFREINPILAGWLNYFRVGHASRRFAAMRMAGRDESATSLGEGGKEARTRPKEVE